MEDTILAVLHEINEAIISYKGDNLFEAGILDSLQVVDIVAELEEQLDIDIDAKYVIEENFKTKEAIIRFIMKINS